MPFTGDLEHVPSPTIPSLRALGCFRSEFLNFAFWAGQFFVIILYWGRGAVLYLAGPSAASLVSVPWKPLACPSPTSRDTLSQTNVPWGTKLSPTENHCFREIEKWEGVLCFLSKSYRAIYIFHLFACISLKKEQEREGLMDH